MGTNEGVKRFTNDGEDYSITVFETDHVGFAYVVESVQRGRLESGTLPTIDPWGRVAEMFPETTAVEITEA